jgi:hypothetical protein
MSATENGPTAIADAAPHQADQQQYYTDPQHRVKQQQPDNDEDDAQGNHARHLGSNSSSNSSKMITPNSTWTIVLESIVRAPS